VGKHIVLISGDEEYRSEEALPMLARILTMHHGFRCTVLFSQDPETGVIDPDQSHHIPGLEVLRTADMVVLFTRFRRLPDADMKHIVDYVERGGSMLGIRTATHAFAYEKDSDSAYAQWHWRSKSWPGGFGRQVLGETWVAHHGRHGSESTRGVQTDAGRQHPILRGVESIWGPTDVYAVSELPGDAVVLVEGAILKGMSPEDDPVEGERNSPLTPIIWVRELEIEGSESKQRIACSTIGAAVDLESEGLRRAFVNACYWGARIEDRIPARSQVDLVGSYEPTMFGFGGYKRGVMPADHALPSGEDQSPARDSR